MNNNYVTLQNVSKIFNSSEGDFAALKNINLTINQGDIFGIIGLSGAGKSTLVRCINLLEKPTTGQIFFENSEMTALSPSLLRKKRKNIGMIFQGFNLFMQKTVLQNICFPLILEKTPKNIAIAKARELLEVVGLSDKENAYPIQLSGGQKQRVAIARALATQPGLLLCDEATSALDPATTKDILALLKKINKEMNVTIIIITHEMSVIEEICNRVAVIEHGCIAEEGLSEQIFINPKSISAKNLTSFNTTNLRRTKSYA